MKRKYKYTPKQALGYAKRTKKEQRKKYWQKKAEAIEKRIEKDLRKLEIMTGKLQRKKTIEKYNRKLEELRKYTKEEKRKEMKERAEIQIKEARAKIGRKEDIFKFFKKETISEQRAKYEELGNAKGIYSKLLDKAMKNPNKFKEGIIEQIDKIKKMLEIELEIYTRNENNYVQLRTTIKVTGRKTIEEIKQKMDEYGISPEEIIDSMKIQHFANSIEAQSWMDNKKGEKIREITMKIKLIKGGK